MRSGQDLALYGIAAAIGVGLIVLARWAARRGQRWESWVALRVGDAYFTEIAGAFLIGAGIGGTLLTVLGTDSDVSSRRVVAPGRFGGRFGPFDMRNLPFVFGLVGAAIAFLSRADLVSLFMRQSPSHNAMTTYFGTEATVLSAIPRGGYGDISLRDPYGALMTVSATADEDLAVGTTVRITGRRGATPSVTAVAAGEPSPGDRLPDRESGVTALERAQR